MLLSFPFLCFLAKESKMLWEMCVFIDVFSYVPFQTSGSEKSLKDSQLVMQIKKYQERSGLIICKSQSLIKKNILKTKTMILLPRN